MSKARMLGYNKPYVPNNRADRKHRNHLTGKAQPAAKKITTKEKRP